MTGLWKIFRIFARVIDTNHEMNENFAIQFFEGNKVHNTGQHTTTFSEMISLSETSGISGESGYLIDTPGIKSRYQSYLSMLNDKDDSKYREAY